MTTEHLDLHVLIAVGLPIAGPRREEGNLLAAVDFLNNLCKHGTEHLEERIIDALQAWLLGLRDHFPSTFHSLSLSPPLLNILQRPITGRIIKLRRIAIDGLSKVA